MKSIVSEKRPSEPVQPPLSKQQPEYWLERVFKNSFTYKGRQHCVRRWSVKIQHNRRRKSFTLQSPLRAEAAVEACELYQMLLSAGWDAVQPKPPVLFREGRPAPASHPGPPAKLLPAYWRPRLIIRKYTELLRPQPIREFSVRIEHNGTGQYFPLESSDADEAARRAADIYRAVLVRGWAQANLLHRREITVGIFWSLKPFACTYTTLFSLPAPSSQPVAAPRPGRKSVILLIEPDGGVSAALTTWLARQTDFPAVVIRAPLDRWEEACAREQPALVLANRNLPGISGAELIHRLGQKWPEIPAFTYGVFEDSDQIFASLSGVAAGYMMRRRPPSALLEPISRWRGQGPLMTLQARSQVRKYFQSFFEFAQTKEDAAYDTLLTYREHEILEYLSKGHQDKEIAEKLAISAWTVHSHLKNIFKKYRVHSRTEAVIEYLQR